MKNLKIFALVLTMALLITAAVCTTVFAADDAEAPVIVSKNLSYEDSTHLYYAVALTDNVTAANTTLNVYSDAACTNVLATGIAGKVETLNALGGDFIVFRAPGIAAKHITRDVYAQAVTADGGKSEVVKYSVAEYLYERLYVSERLGKTVTAEQKALYQSYLAYGANAQTVFTNSKIENAEDKEVLATALNIVRVIDGTLDDGSVQKLVKAGSNATVVATPTDASIAQWQVTTITADETTTDKVDVTAAIAIKGNTVISEIQPLNVPKLTFDSAEDLKYLSLATTNAGKLPEATYHTSTISAKEGKLHFDSSINGWDRLSINQTFANEGERAIFETDLSISAGDYQSSKIPVYFEFKNKTNGASEVKLHFYITPEGVIEFNGLNAIVDGNETSTAGTYVDSGFKEGDTFTLRLEYYINPYGYANIDVFVNGTQAGRATLGTTQNKIPAKDVYMYIEASAWEEWNIYFDNLRFWCE